MNEPMPPRPHEPASVIFRWDLDKTYVQTEFSSVRGLLQAAVEGAHRKRTIPGMRSLLGALSQAPGARVIVSSAPIGSGPGIVPQPSGVSREPTPTFTPNAHTVPPTLTPVTTSKPWLVPQWKIASTSGR